MKAVRQPAVAGQFYPNDAQELRNSVDQFLAQANSTGPAPKALIIPHAAHRYSGPVAASAYHLLKPKRDTITRVVLLGPSHRVPMQGLATSSACSFASPLGEVMLDHSVINQLFQFPQVRERDVAHIEEHSIEVHLPFLQAILGNFKLLPLVIGDATPTEVSEVLEDVWGGEETVIIISSDLSHYQSYEKSVLMDQATTEAIVNLNVGKIRHADACGCNPINGLLKVAAKKQMTAKLIDQRNSGDTAGPLEQVVGYGAYGFIENPY